MRIEVGYGLEGRITDGRAGEILDTYAVPRFKSGEYDWRLLDGFLAIKGDVQKEYGTEAGGEETPSASESGNNLFFIFLGIFALPAGLFKYKREYKKLKSGEDIKS